MEKTFTVVLSILTIIGAILVAMLTPGSFLIHPVFDITLAKSTTVENITQISITNIGWVQAKNVKIDVLSLSKFRILSANCPENNITTSHEWIENIKIELPRMSANLDCMIEFETMEENNIYQVVGTADDSPAFIWKLDTKQTKTLSGIEYVLFWILIVGGLIGSYWLNYYGDKGRWPFSKDKPSDKL